MAGRANLIRGGVALGFVAALGVAVVFLRPDSAPPAKGKAAPPPTPVVTTQVKETKLVVEQRYLGEVWATSDAALTVAESGRVREVEVREGDRVRRGDLLLTVDDRLARAQAKEAKAASRSVKIQAKNAQRQAKRYEKLAEERVFTSIDAENQASTALSLAAQGLAAGAQVQVSSERVRRHRIVAPFEGVVAQRHVDPGDWLDAGEPALRIVTDRRVEVHVRVPAKLLSNLEAVRGVRIHQGTKHVAARISGAVQALDRDTRTALLRLTPETQEKWLIAGSSLDVAFSLERTGGLVVPRDALVYGVSKIRVFQLTPEKKVTPIVVNVVTQSGSAALVEAKELKLGTEIVVRGNERLRPGQPVTVGSAAVSSSG